MQIIGDVFNIILFVSIIGGAATVLSLLINRISHFTLPLWFSICQMAAYIIPLLAPGLYLIPPEDHSWRQGYYVACSAWFCGIIVLAVYDIIKMAFAHRAIRNYEVCRDKRIHEICSQFAKRRISQLSGGMKRRVGIASALVGDPRVLIVDEPTAGLDPEERVRFRGVLSRFAKDGKCVLLSTHIVEDVYQLCERLAVLRKGTLFFCGSAEDLLSHVAGKIKVIELESENDLIAMQKKTVVIATTYEHNKIQARVMDENNLFSVPAVTETLEDAYVYCMGGKAYA